jgi:hypothetical protein
MLREATIGRFGGLAVFDRALTDDEVRRLHEAARIDLLPGDVRGAVEPDRGK